MTEALGGLSEVTELAGIATAEALVMGGLVYGMRKAFTSQKALALINAFSPDETNRIVDYAEQTIEYAQQEKIGAIALVDSAARPFAYPLITAWRERFAAQPDAPRRPPIFCVNPQGFVSRSNLSVMTALQTTLKPLIKADRVELPNKRREASDIRASFPEQHPRLYALRDKPLLVIDSCIHSGRTVRPLFDGLAEAGFNDVRLGVAHCKASKAPRGIKPDLIFDSKTPAGGCYPWGVERLTEKTFSTPYNRRVDDAKRRAAGKSLRVNLRQALDAHYALRGESQ